MAEQHEALVQMRVKVEQVVQENDRLSGDLDHHMALLSSRADASIAGVPEEHLELMDRIELLTRENNLLMLHQQDQHKAIAQGALQTRRPAHRLVVPPCSVASVLRFSEAFKRAHSVLVHWQRTAAFGWGGGPCSPRAFYQGDLGGVTTIE